MTKPVSGLIAGLFLFILFALTMPQGTYAQDLKPVGNTADLQAMFDSHKGKVVLVNFWATWCKPCVKEFPELMKLYQNYKDKGFELVFISLDDLSEIDSKLKPFLVKYNVDFTTYYNTFAKPEELIDYIDKSWVGAIPSTYIYDKEGVLKKSILGNKTYEQFEQEITILLD
jgi:thiol-disulfide isomerase/thioredoxin